MVALNFTPSRRWIARLSVRKRLEEGTGDEREDDGAGEPDSEHRVVNDDVEDSEERDDSDDKLDVELGADLPGDFKDSSGSVPKIAFCSGVR